jgi:hypothetical protein
MASGDHFSSAGDPMLPREMRERRLAQERKDRKDRAVGQLRQAMMCLLLEVPASIVDDIKKKAEAVIALLE